MKWFLPDSYKYDPELWLANQAGHAFLGVVAAVAICLVWFGVAGEFPVRWHTWLTIFCTYVAYELHEQRWQGADTIEDAMFVAVYGAGSILYTFKEVDIGTGDFGGNILDLLPFLATATVHFIAGFFLRVRNLRRLKRSENE